MAKAKTNTKSNAIDPSGVSIETKLQLLYELQSIDSKIDSIITLRGELPLEVQDLENETVGLTARMTNYGDEVHEMESMIAKKKSDIDDSKALMKKYKEQQDNVRNNREYDSLSKEIEFQTLEIELSEKNIKEYTFQTKEKKRLKEETAATLADKKIALKVKQEELKEIVSETQKEEDDLRKLSDICKEKIEPRLLTAYERVRGNARNGLAVVSVSRDACGGCFNKIPPQRQVDIKLNKNIAICEYCGRFLVSEELVADMQSENAEQ